MANWIPAPQAHWPGGDHERYPDQAPRYRGALGSLKLGRKTLASSFLGAQSGPTRVINKYLWVICWRGPSTVLEALWADRQQCFSLVSELFGIEIREWSSVPRASIDLATTESERDHLHNNATSQTLVCPVAGILMLHATQKQGRHLQPCWFQEGSTPPAAARSLPKGMSPLLVPKTKDGQAKPLACLSKIIAAEAP